MYFFSKVFSNNKWVALQFFWGAKGLRQGDPVSPFLYMIMMEALSRQISKIKNNGGWKGIEITRNIPTVSHQLFVDDTILYGAASIEEAQGIKEILEKYCAKSGQQINARKSNIYFVNTPKGLQQRISNVMGFSIGQLPSKYLGIPLFAGASKLNL